MMKGTVLALFCLLISVKSSQIFLFPSEEELVIQSGSAIKLRCESRHETAWHYNVYSSSELINHDIESRVNITSWTNPGSDFPFISEIVVTNSSYLDTGYFTCAQKKTTDSQDSTYEKKIYIYVDGSSQLLAVQNEDLLHMLSYVGHRTVIPCRPTAPTGILVELEHNDETVYPPEGNDVKEQWTFSPREGFALESASVHDSGRYFCKAMKGNRVENKNIYLTVTPVSEYNLEPVVSRIDGRHVEVGGNFTLKCTVIYPVGGYVYVNWTLPDVSGLEEKRISISETTRELLDETNYEATSFVSVHHAKESDAGRYTCQASSGDDHSAESLSVDIFAKNTEVLNITLGVKDIIETVGRDARWVATIHAAYPHPEIIWTNQKGEELKTEKNVRVVTTETNSSLLISKVQGRDSGCYTFFASAGSLSESVNLTLKVKEKPSTAIENSNKFVVANEKQSISCIAEGYPLAKIMWEFRNCSSPKNCSPAFQSIEIYNPNKEKGGRAFSESTSSTCDLVRKKSTLLLKGTQSGEYRCSSRNEFGGSDAVTQFFVVPSNEPIELTVSKAELFVGENLSLKCGISLFNFTRGIKWQFMRKATDAVVDLIENENGILIFKNENQYGYYETLEKQNATLDDAGIYVCRANSLENEPFKQMLHIRPSEPIPPVIPVYKFPERVEKGKPVVLQCNYTGQPKPEITWTKDGERVAQSEQNILQDDGYSATLKMPFVTNDQAGKYVCEFRSIAGVTSAEGIVHVDEPPLSAWIPIVGVTLAVTVIVLLVILFIKIKKEKQRKAFLAQHNLEKFEEGNPEIISPEQTLDEQAELLPYNKKSWEFPKERLKLGKQIGAGAFGRVVMAEAVGIVEGEARTVVAVKMLKASPDREALTSALQALVKELKIMTNLGKHLNVVNLLGACTRDIDKGDLFLIVEYCKFGNILRYMQKKRTNFVDQVDRRTSKIDVAIGVDRLVRSMSGTSQRSVSSTAPLIPPDSPLIHFAPSPTAKNAPGTLFGHENGAMTYMRRLSNGKTSGYDDSSSQVIAPWALNYRGDIDDKPLCTNDLLCWSYQIASGMEYLASRKVCHGDLAARNILLTENNIVKISDFGLSREVYRSGLYTKKSDTPMPVKWMAPESITTRVFSTQSDVWAFGVTLWEIFSLGEMPYAGVDPNMKFVESLMDGSGLLKMPTYATKDMYDVMRECWRRIPKERPNFSELKEHISYLLDETTKQMYLDLNQSYITMNQAQFQDRIDYLIQMANPVYENFHGEEGMLGHDYINSPRPNLETGDDGYLSPKQAFINKDGYMIGVNSADGQPDGGSQVFVFPDTTAMFRRLSKLEEEPSEPKESSETQPMLDETGYLQPKALGDVTYANITA